MHATTRRGRARLGLAAAIIAVTASFIVTSTAGAAVTLPGVNNYNCRSSSHPIPVVLVHATLSNANQNWSTLAPMLQSAGYCVFALNYGQTQLSLGDTIDGLGEISLSAVQLERFVNIVLSRTGAKQVDMVGHSQGGMMPNYYIKRLGGASKVHTFVALAPSNHGTSGDGLVQLLAAVGPIVNFGLAAAGAPALPEQENSSAFITNLFRDGDTVEGPRYWVIETDHDEVVTPYTNAFLKAASGVTVSNILIQSQCPTDPVGHIGLASDGPALSDVLNALGGGSPSFQPNCANFGEDL